MAKIGPNGLPYVLPNKKALPFTPGSYTAIANSTPEGRMALRNNDFNSYMGNSAGAYSNPTPQVDSTSLAATSLDKSGINGQPTGVNYSQAPVNIGIDDLVSKYSPEQLGGMDFSKYAAGSLGTEGNGIFDGGLAGMLSNKDLMGGLSAVGSGIGTAFDIYNNLWGGAADARKASIRNANAQADYNEQAANHKKEFYSGMANSGLAASGV
jgi:putative hemolysin